MQIKYTFLILIILIILTKVVFAQTGSIAGTISDSLSKATLPGCIVILKEKEQGTSTNGLGKFSFTDLMQGYYVLQVSFIGYKSKAISVYVEQNKTVTLDIKLIPAAINIKEVSVTESRSPMEAMNTISSLDILQRPVNSAQDLMSLVPGLFLAQHQGGGKAEQIFLRGFDADHGTDFAVFWDGIPINMPSHAHGQGYADSHFMIPETIDQLDVYKGTYATQFGDFATAGVATFTTKNTVDNMVKFEAGTYGMNRIMGMLNLLGNKHHLLTKKKEYAYISAENMYNQATYFVHPQDYSRVNILGKYFGQLSDKTTLTLEGSYFNSTWNGSGQIPVRAVTEGLITRFGSLDPSEGGHTDRTNANVILKTYFDNGAILKNQVYYSFYQLNLFTDFTFYLTDTLHGDGINQRDNGRSVFGYNGSYEINNDLAGHNLKTVIGLTTRGDMGQLSLRHQEDRVILDTVSMGNLYEQSYSLYLDETYQFTNKFFINAGIRADVFDMNYRDIMPYDTFTEDNTGYVSYNGSKVSGKVSPKLNLYYDFNKDVQFFIRSGYGFHSNDARAVVSNPNVSTLPAALGYEIGSTFKPFSKMLVNAALWGIHLANELTLDQDIPQENINGPTQRLGADLSIRYQLTKVLYFDLDMNYSHGRFMDSAVGHNYIPLAPTFTSVAGLTVKTGGFSASLRYRAIDNRPANNDYTVIAQGYFVMDGIVKYRIKNIEFGATVENIFNVEWNEAQFDTLTRLNGESVGGIDQLCYTPGAPRLIKGSISVFF